MLFCVNLFSLSISAGIAQEIQQIDEQINAMTIGFFKDAFKSDELAPHVNAANQQVEYQTKLIIKTAPVEGLLGEYDARVNWWCEQLKNNFKTTNKKLDLKYRLLLYGPPGNGKTTIAKHMAKISGRELFAVAGSAIVGNYIGDASKNIQQIFNNAKKHIEEKKQNVVILIDEVDQVAAQNSNSEHRSEHRAGTAQLWLELDKYNDPSIFFIVTTNRFDKLTPAFAQRFDQCNRIEIKNPNATTRRQLFLIGPINHNNENLLNNLVEKSEGLSIREILGIGRTLHVYAQIHIQPINDLITIPDARFYECLEDALHEHDKLIMQELIDKLCKNFDDYQKRLMILFYLFQIAQIKLINKGIYNNAHPVKNGIETQIAGNLASHGILGFLRFWG